MTLEASTRESALKCGEIIRSISLTHSSFAHQMPVMHLTHTMSHTLSLLCLIILIAHTFSQDDACVNVTCPSDQICVSGMQNGRIITRCVPVPRDTMNAEESADLAAPMAPMMSRPQHGGARAYAAPSTTLMATRASAGSIGLTPGGAQDITNARENIKNGFMPLPQSITYEGIFSEYYFDITGDQECLDGQLFCPAFQTRISTDPFTETGSATPKEERYMAVGLQSTLSAADWSRPRLNLGLVLDISGSMSVGMADYYYDFQNSTWRRNEEETITKMKVARESLVNVLQRLKPDDQVSIVVFDDQAELVQPMQKISDIDLPALTRRLLALEPRGGTDMSAGYGMMLNEFKKVTESSGVGVENRIIMLTDAQPNWGTVNPQGLNRMIIDAYEKQNAGIGTTFLLIGLDANTELIELMSKVRGSNYFSIQSVPEFRDRLRRAFDFMVTPLIFDLSMTMAQSKGYTLKHVYGSPDVDANNENPQLIHVKTLFPSETSERGVKGGLVLLLLEKNPNCAGDDCEMIKLDVKYETRDGRISTVSRSFSYADTLPENENDDSQDSIRKGILLTRYGRTLKFWLQTERKVEHPISPRVIWREGLPVDFPQSHEWELLSQTLTVSPAMKEVFKRLKQVWVDEMAAIEDPDLQKDLDILEKLLKAPDRPAPERPANGPAESDRPFAPRGGFPRPSRRPTGEYLTV